MNALSIAKGHVGMIGLGKMGANLCRRLADQNWKVTGYDASAELRATLRSEGLSAVDSISEVIMALPTPRVIWVMVPAEKIFDEIVFGTDDVAGLTSTLERGDIVIDGGNSHYKDSVRRGKLLEDLGIHFIDVGTSGGPGGARSGPCLMVGGSREAYAVLEGFFTDLALPGGVKFFEGHGAGHYVKMIHNGIEYGMMQAIAEGFEVLKKSEYGLDLVEVADLYQHGSVIESKLVGWGKDGLEQYGQDLESISGTVAHSGEGAWTIEAAQEQGTPVPVIKASLQFRVDSAEKPSYTGRFLSMLRGMFGGHAVK